MASEHFSTLMHALLNKDPYIVPGEASLIILDSKYAVYMSKNDKDTKNTRHIDRRVHFLINGERYKMHKIECCDGSL